jgi:hypothetical protein
MIGSRTATNETAGQLTRLLLLAVVAGDEPRVVPPPKLIGDAIVCLDDNNVGTAIFWNKGKYHWYPVNKYPPRKSR